MALCSTLNTEVVVFNRPQGPGRSINFESAVTVRCVGKKINESELGIVHPLLSEVITASRNAVNRR